jgi:hypothetical protein
MIAIYFSEIHRLSALVNLVLDKEQAKRRFEINMNE